MVAKETETVLSSPASSVVLVTKEDISGSSEENDEDQGDGDGDEEGLTQQERRGNTDRLLFISCENSCLIIFTLRLGSVKAIGTIIFLSRICVRIDFRLCL